MRTTRLLPLDRFINPRRAALASFIQTLVSLAVFMAAFFAGAGLKLWPAPPYGAAVPTAARSGLIGSVVLALIVIRLIRRGLPNRIFPDYRRAELLIMSRQYESARAPLRRQIDALKESSYADRNRTWLLLDYSEYGYLESALIMLAVLEAGRGDIAEARRLLVEAKSANPENLLVAELLGDMDGTARKAREIIANDETRD